MRIGALKICVAYILIILFYLSLSDFFGLLDTSLFMYGELYDYIFLLSFILLFLMCFFWKGKFKLIKKNVVFWPYYMLIILSSIEMFHLLGTQNLGESISVIRELLFIFIYIVFINLNYDVDNAIKIIIVMDALGSIIYFIEMVFGGPIFSEQLHTRGIYEAIGNFKVWRCWVDIPAFELFTIPYLLIHLIKKRNVFKRRETDIVLFIVIVIGVIQKLGRIELFAVLFCIIIGYFSIGSKNIRKYLRKMIMVCMILLILLFLLFIFFNGFFTRIFSGILAVFNLGNLRYSSTLRIRFMALLLRFKYIKNNAGLLFGLGPLSRNYDLIININDGANRGVLASDIAYATFILRYGLVGTGLYIVGNILNFMRLRKEDSYIAIAVGIMMIGILIMGIGGYEAMGKQTLLKVGILFALYIKENNICK